MELWSVLNEELMPASACRIAVTDLSVQRGYAVFDFFKTRNGRPVFLPDHLQRFQRSAAALRLPLPSLDVLENRIVQLLAKNDLPDSGVRLTLTGGLSPDGYSLSQPQLIITQQALELPTEAAFEKGLHLVTYAHQRQLPHVKTIDYLMPIWLQPWIKGQQADDVLYHQNGAITECPRANFFIVTPQAVARTPAENILPGITRSKLWQATHIPVEAAPITFTDLASATEAFISSTTKQILPVTAIDGRPVSNGLPEPVTRSLAQYLEALMQQEL